MTRTPFVATATPKLDHPGLRPAPCKICGAESLPFDTVDMGKTCLETVYPLGVYGIPVVYKRCPDCRFIFTNDFDHFTESDWSSTIYNDRYIDVDPDYALRRPILSAGLIASQFSKRDIVGLDYGGGSGVMAGHLRKQGWTYDAFDPFGQTSLTPGLVGSYNLCSAFEVIEHLTDPAEAMKAILDMCSKDRVMLVIGTNVHDRFVTDRSRLSWWYAAPRNGHISLFSKEALRRLGARFGLDYASFGISTHFLSRGWTPGAVATMAVAGKARRQMFRRYRV